MKPNIEREQESINRDLFLEILADHCEKQIEKCKLYYIESLSEGIKGGLHFYLKRAQIYFQKQDKILFNFLKTFKLNYVDEKISNITEDDLNKSLSKFNKYDDQKIEELLNKRLDNNYYGKPNQQNELLDSFAIFITYFSKIKFRITDKKDFILGRDFPKILAVDRKLSELTRCTIHHDILKLIAAEQSRVKNIIISKQAQIDNGHAPFIERALDNLTYDELRTKNRKKRSLNGAAKAIEKYIDENKKNWPERDEAKNLVATPDIGTIKGHLKREYQITKDNIQEIKNRVQ